MQFSALFTICPDQARWCQQDNPALAAQGPDRRPVGAANPAGNVIQNATERAARLPSGNSHVVLEPTGGSAFPGLDAQDLPIALNSGAGGNQRGPFFFGISPPPPPPRKNDLQLTLGLPHLPPLFGAGSDPDLNPIAGRSLAPGLGMQAGADIPDPNKGPVTVIPGAVEVTSPTSTPQVCLLCINFGLRLVLLRQLVRRACNTSGILRLIVCPCRL
jgi:hypothetical protein